MKKFLALLLTLLLVLSMAACGEDAPQTTTAGKTDTTTVSDDTTAAEDTTAADTADDTTAAGLSAPDPTSYGFTLAGVKMTPGDVFDPAGLPEAESVFEMTSCAFEGTDKMYNYGTIELTAADDGKSQIIYSIVILDPNTPTDEGLYLGDPLSTVTDIYGTEYAENGNQITYQTEDTLFILIMQNGYVSSIEYRMDI